MELKKNPLFDEKKAFNRYFGIIKSILPNFIMFLILSYVYLWGLNKYGFERTVVVALVTVIVVLNGKH